MNGYGILKCLRRIVCIGESGKPQGGKNSVDVVVNRDGIGGDEDFTAIPGGGRKPVFIRSRVRGDRNRWQASDCEIAGSINKAVSLLSGQRLEFR